MPDPEAPQNLEVSKKLEAPKLKGIVIESPPREQIKTPPAPVDGKGKGKLVEPARPLKKQRLGPILEQRQLFSTTELTDKMEKLDLQNYLLLHKKAGASGQAMSIDLLARMVQSSNLISADLWDRFKTKSPSLFLSSA